MKKLNSSLASLVGKPACATDGHMTDPSNTSSSSKGDLGMGKFNPRAGATNKGKMHQGVSGGGRKADLGMGKFNPRAGANTNGKYVGGG